MKGKIKKIKKWFSEKYYRVMLIDSIRKYYHWNKLGDSKAIMMMYNCRSVVVETLDNGGSLFDRKLNKYIQIDEIYDELWKYTYGVIFVEERYFLSEKSNKI